ncbi:MAG TPA: DEAD/DEAH box helicase family protein, partial [Thermomicrobiales bacterium]|nr:DEAD/DEAH box helicase family protein [Thermomicrobiales bacterium]
AQLRSIVAGSYVYDLSPVALWGAAARGVTASDLLAELANASSMPIPGPTAARIVEVIGRYGAVEIVNWDSRTALVARSREVLIEIGIEPPADGSKTVALAQRDVARYKLAAVRAGWPVVDRRQRESITLPIVLRDDVRLRTYQAGAVAAFEAGRDGVVLLPCGAGKTMVGVAAAAQSGGPVLVLVPSRTVGEQWRAAFSNATHCHPEHVCWSGDPGNDQQITIATYHAATSGKVAGELVGRRWRLVVYDEVQSLPADMFRLAAAVEADRRLGLSATLVREDGREAEVFALVGPPLYEASWLELERDGWIAPARCIEVRVPAGSIDSESLRYRMAVVQRLLAQHDREATIVVGTDVASLRAIGKRLGFPVLTGASSTERRAAYLGAFRAGEVRTLGLSRIGTVGIDLPDASVLIQVSGTFGSRQEEAQRLGRVLRPAAGKTAHFYTIVAAGTREQHFAARRQRFLVNQGYTYDILDAATLPRTQSPS